MEVTLGPLQFALHAAMTAIPPAFAPRPLLISAGAEVAAVEECGQRWLVVDHRRDPGGGASARIEFWSPTRSGELRVDGLLVMADAAHACASWRPQSIHELATRLAR